MCDQFVNSFFNQMTALKFMYWKYWKFRLSGSVAVLLGLLMDQDSWESEETDSVPLFEKLYHSVQNICFYSIQ